jgi:hypothetical protein
MSYFPKGIRYEEGGIASAFNHVDPDAYKPRLLHCKGKHNVRVTQVCSTPFNVLGLFGPDRPASPVCGTRCRSR